MAHNDFISQCTRVVKKLLESYPLDYQQPFDQGLEWVLMLDSIWVLVKLETSHTYRTSI